MALSSSLYDRTISAIARKRLFRTAESTVPHRRKSSSGTRKSPFRMAEKPLLRRWKRTLIMSDNISYCVSAEYVKRPKAAYLQPKACLRAKTAVFSRCDVYLYMRPCIFMHASMYIYSYINTYLRVFVLRTARHATVFLPPRDNMKGDAPLTPNCDATKEWRRHGYAHFCIFNGYFCIFIRF
mgnify:CR=1 FL=1